MEEINIRDKTRQYVKWGK